MQVNESVQQSIDDWSMGRLNFAMMHACMAIDGTAKKKWPTMEVGARFRKLIRDHYSIFGPMAAPHVDLDEVKFLERIAKDGSVTQLDMADVIYKIHRCSHAHGDELPEGFELVPDAHMVGMTRIFGDVGKVRLSDRTIFGLLAVAIVQPENIGQAVDDGYYLTFEGRVHFINTLWGEADSFREVVQDIRLPITLDVKGDWPPPIVVGK